MLQISLSRGEVKRAGHLYYIGLDPAMRKNEAGDFFAIVAIDVTWSEADDDGGESRGTGTPRLVGPEGGPVPHVIVKYAKRMPDGSFTSTARRVLKLSTLPELTSQVRRISPEGQNLYYDYPPCVLVETNGPGEEMPNTLRTLGVEPIEVHTSAGVAVNRLSATRYSVPRHVMIYRTLALAEAGQLGVAPGVLREVPDVLEELRKYRFKQKSTTGYTYMEAESQSDHDDLISAMSMACWAATAEQRYRPRYPRDLRPIPKQALRERGWNV